MPTASMLTDQPGADQRAEVKRRRVLAQPETAHEIADRSFAALQVFENPASGGVGNGAEDAVGASGSAHVRLSSASVRLGLSKIPTKLGLFSGRSSEASSGPSPS